MPEQISLPGFHAPGPFHVPLLVGLEGIDGCGKTTQVGTLTSLLKAMPVKFPNYESDTGKLIASVIRGDVQMDPLVFQCVQTVDKYAVVPHIHSFLSAGNSVVMDRYMASAMAYGASDGLDHNWLWDIHACMPKPDLYVLIDISPSVSFDRRPERAALYEADKDALRRINREYRNLFYSAPPMPSWRGGQTEWVVVDGHQSPSEVTEAIMVAARRIQDRLWNEARTSG